MTLIKAFRMKNYPQYLLEVTSLLIQTSRLQYSQFQGMDCSYCRNSYNRKQRQPISVCIDNHTICSSCIRQIQKSSKALCPICLETFLPNLQVNMAIFEQLPKNQPVANQPKYNPISAESPQMMSSEKILDDRNYNSRPVVSPRERLQPTGQQFQMDIGYGCFWFWFFAIQLLFMIPSFILGAQKQTPSTTKSGCLSSYDTVWNWLLGSAIFDLIFLIVALICLILLIRRMVDHQNGKIITRVFMVLEYIKILIYAVIIFIIIGSITNPDCIQNTTDFMAINGVIFNLIFWGVLCSACCYGCCQTFKKNPAIY